MTRIGALLRGVQVHFCHTERMTTTRLWRRIDLPGHDTCRLLQHKRGWRLEGFAAFLHHDSPAGLNYRIDCDRAWRTRQGRVRGWVGDSPIDVTITHTRNGAWSLNGAVITGLNECIDLDLGFTPATNAIQLRRVVMAIGHSAEIPVVWYDIDAATLHPLKQRYERRSEETFWYEAPRFNYAALLRVNAQGFIEAYPALWETESAK